MKYPQSGWRGGNTAPRAFSPGEGGGFQAPKPGNSGNYVPDIPANNPRRGGSGGPPKGVPPRRLAIGSIRFLSRLGLVGAVTGIGVEYAYDYFNSRSLGPVVVGGGWGLFNFCRLGSPDRYVLSNTGANSCLTSQTGLNNVYVPGMIITTSLTRLAIYEQYYQSGNPVPQYRTLQNFRKPAGTSSVTLKTAGVYNIRPWANPARPLQSPDFMPDFNFKVRAGTPEPGTQPAGPRPPREKPPSKANYPSPPKKGEKERKGRAKTAVAIAARIAFAASEWVDLIDALYDALPKKLRNELREKYGGKLKPQEKAQELYKNASKIDLEDAVLNVIANQIEDAVVGRTSGKVDNYLRDVIGTSTSQGLQVRI